MDETEGKNAQDSSLNGDTSGDAGGNTSSETYTKAQLDEAVVKARSDALAKAGRDAKALEAREVSIAEQEKKHQQWQREQEEAEAEKYRDDPEGMKSLQEKRRQKQEREALDADKAAHAEKLTRADELELEVNVWKAAQSKGIDASELKDVCAELGLKTEAQINRQAEIMGKAAKPDTLKVDSNRGIGGRDLSNLSPDDKIAEGLRQAKKK